MRRLVTLLAVFGALALAESWNGKLADATCAARQKGAACNPTGATTAFVLTASDGKMYKLDEGGNKKAAEAIRSRADRSKDPNALGASAAPVNANISGSLEGDTIKVETISVD